MRKQLCIGVLAVSFLVSALAGVTASAQSGNNIRAQIPFDFYVGDKMVAAGRCTVTAITSDGMALRIDHDGRQNIAALTNPAKGLDRVANPRLVFHKYGDQYFLAAVWGADGDGRALRESKRERNLRRELEVARGGSALMEVVTVNAQ